MSGIVAFKGIMTLEKAVWDNVFGMYVQFKMGELTGPNPFKKFTSMKKGRVGTRFDAVFNSCKNAATVYEDEAMLKGWTDGTTGSKVTFWIAPGTSFHPFMERENGEEFAVVMVELDDDQEPIDQVKREKLSKPRKQHLSNYAAQLCRDSNFHDWLASTQDWPRGGTSYQEQAKQWMYKACMISSRAELDSDPMAAERFHQTVRGPFAEWNSRAS